MMQSLRKRLSIILITCSIAAVILSAIFVNLAVYRTFNNYLKDNQNNRNERIVQYFEEVYKEDKRWTPNSGEEMMHEAYMGNYCLTLLDEDKKIIWEMDPNDVRNKISIMMNGVQKKGIYTSQTFNINVNNKTVGYVVIGQYSPVLLSEDDINFKTSINYGIFFSTILTILIASLISLAISKQFSKPIKEVADTSVDLSKGNYESRSDINSNIKEIDDLINSIDTLGSKLREQDLLRKRLVSDISHEIRTPLNVLQNNLEAMIDGIVPITEERLSNLDDEVIRFGKLLDNLKVLKQFEAEKLEIKLERIKLNKIVSAVCKDFEIAARDKGIEIAYNTDSAKSYEVLGDIDKLKQVFINIISNAIKFNNEGGMVWANLRNEKDRIIVQIRDNGLGIKKEDIPFIFERLYRGDKSRHEIEGSGIGLTIVKRILEAHGAEIDVESDEGKGTLFTLNFNKYNME